MATVSKDRCSSIDAAADLSSYQFYVIRLSAAHKANLASDSAATDLIGALQNAPESGEAIKVPKPGETGRVIAHEAFAFGCYLTGDAAGSRAAKADDGDMCFGRALEAAAAQGDVIEYEQISPTEIADVSDCSAANA